MLYLWVFCCGEIVESDLASVEIRSKGEYSASFVDSLRSFQWYAQDGIILGR